MRVRLGYTVNEEDVLTEAANIVSLSGGQIQRALEVFKELQLTLKGQDAEGGFVIQNPTKGLELIDEFRKILFSVDTRLGEVGEIVAGYLDYYARQLTAVEEAPEPTPLTDAASSAVLSESSE